MKTLKIERYEEHTLILEEGTDYDKDDLVPDGFANNKLFGLSADKLTQIAKDNGFDKWTWTGFAKEQEDNEHKAGVKVKFAKFI